MDLKTPAPGSTTSAFAQLVAALDYPLYVITTAVQGEPTGCLIGFATQCSIHPPRFLACISKKNHTFQLARRATVFAVHVVDEDNKALAEAFGGEDRGRSGQVCGCALALRRWSAGPR